MTVEEVEQKQKMAATENNDADIFGYYAEPPLVAVNLFHLRNGRVVDRHEYFLGRRSSNTKRTSSSPRCSCSSTFDQQLHPIG